MKKDFILSEIQLLCYCWLVDIICDMIDCGLFIDNQVLLFECELVEYYEVSCDMVCKVLCYMEECGIIYSDYGCGIFVLLVIVCGIMCFIDSFL